MMHTLIDEAVLLETVIDLNESTNKPTYYIQGTFSTIEERNRNGRLYPRHIWETEVSKYINVIKENQVNSLLELEHPADGRAYVEPTNAVAKMVDIRIEGNRVMGKAKLLDTPKGLILQELAKNGIPISVSSRGVGSLAPDGTVKSYTIVNFDVVSQPSDHNANLSSVQESLIQSTNFDITPEGNIVKVCTKNSCITEHREVIDEAVIEKFRTMFEEMKPEVSNDRRTPLKLPISFANVTVGDFIMVMKMLNHTDKIARFMEITQMIEGLEEQDKYITFQTIRRLNQAIRSKRYIQSIDKNAQELPTQNKE